MYRSEEVALEVNSSGLNHGDHTGVSSGAKQACEQGFAHSSAANDLKTVHGLTVSLDTILLRRRNFFLTSFDVFQYL